MSLVWDRTDLSQSETLVLLALADHADESGECWPSMQRVAEKARVQRRAAQRIVQKLEERGLVTVERSVGRNHTNRFTLHVEQVLDEKGVEKTLLDKTCLSGQENVSPEATKRVVAVTPESSITTNEPSLDLDVWREWVSYRKELKNVKAYTPAGAQRQMRWLARFTKDQQRQITENSMRQGYQGLFEPKDSGNGTGRNGAKPSAVETVNRATAEWAAQRGVDPASI